MAITYGVVRLGDALKHFRLAWLMLTNDYQGKVSGSGVFIDEDELRADLDVELDVTTGELWVQLPLTTADEIVCQGGEERAATDLDRRRTSTHAKPHPAAAKGRRGAAKRRAAFGFCWQHRGLVISQDEDCAICQGCAECNNRLCEWDCATIADVTITSSEQA